jgi:hypothetical protein
MFTRYADYQADVLEIKGSPIKQVVASFDRMSDFNDYRTDDGYMYVRIRAISSRVNKNHDGWPSIELAGSPEIFDRHKTAGTGFTVEASEGNTKRGFASFVGKPIFVDHNNSNPKRGRGVIVDSKFRVLDHKTAAGDDYWKTADVDPEHLPASEVELLLEVDAKQYPKFAKSILNGDLDGFSMGCNVEYTKCSHCGNVAHDAADFCSHVLMKGAHHTMKTADGNRVSRKSYENCYGCGFFEISGVFEPADETALTREIRAGVIHEGIAVGENEGVTIPDPARPNQEQQVSDLAMQYEMQGVGHEQAIQMAQNNINLTPAGALPGAGDGEVYTPKMKDYAGNSIGSPQTDARGMPGPGGLSGFPPPYYPDANPEGDAFNDAASDALNERWPKRPVKNDPRRSTWNEKLAENPLPQDMMTKSPDDIDTLRNEEMCPICGSDMDSETCKVCGYVKPPTEFDNPDLTEAETVKAEMKEKDEQGAMNLNDTTQPSPTDPSAGGQGPLTSKPPPSKSPVAAAVTNSMKWTPKVNARTAARINQVEVPVHPSSSPVSNEPKSEMVLSDQARPVTSAMLTARRLIETARSNSGETMNARTADGPTPPGDTSAEKRVDVMGVGGIDQASNEEASKAQSQVDLQGVGGTGVEGVEADSTESLPTADQSSMDSGFNTDKTTDDSGPTSTYGDSDGSHSGITDPVTSEQPYWQTEDKWSKSIRQGYDDNTLEQNKQQGDPVAGGGSAVKGVQPIAESFGDRVNVLEHKTSPENNSGPTDTWSGTDGNGVTKQQDPITHEDQEWGGVKVPDVKLHTESAIKARLVQSMRLVRAEMNLGLITEEDEFNRLADVEVMDPVEVRARIQALAQVKVAGKLKLAQHKIASRVPRAFGNVTAGAHEFERIASDGQTKQAAVDDNKLDAALFTR